MAFSVSFVFKGTDQYSSVMKAIAAATRSQTRALESLNTKLRAHKKVVDTSITSNNKMQKRFTALSGSLGTYTKNMEAATAATQSQYRAASQLSRMRSTKFGNQMGVRPSGGSRFGGASAAIGKFSGAGYAMAGIGAGIMAPAMWAIKASMDYEQQFAELHKVVADKFVGKDKELESLRQSILGMGRNGYGVFKTEDITHTAAAVAQHGIYDPKEIMELTKVGLEASKNWDIGVEQSMDQLMGLRNAYHLDSKGVRHLADQMNQLSNFSGARGRNIMEQTMNMAGLTSALHIDPGEAAAIMATQMAIGTTPSMADTTYQKLFNTLASPASMSKPAKAATLSVLTGGKIPTDNNKSLKLLSTFGHQMKTKPVETAIKFMKLLNARGEYKIDEISQIFGKRIYGPQIMLLTQNLEKLQKELDAVHSKDVTRNGGSLHREYEIRSFTAKDQMQAIQSNIGNFGINMGDILNKNHELARSLKELNIQLIAVFTSIEDFTTKNPELTAQIIKATIVVGGIIGILGALALAIQVVTPLVKLLTTVFTSSAIKGFWADLTLLGDAITVFFMPVNILLGILAALIGIFVLLYNKSQPFHALFDAIGNWCMALVENGLADLNETLIVIGASISWVIDKLGDLWNAMRENPLTGWAVKGIEWMMGGATNAINNNADWMRGNASRSNQMSHLIGNYGMDWQNKTAGLGSMMTKHPLGGAIFDKYALNPAMASLMMTANTNKLGGLPINQKLENMNIAGMTMKAKSDITLTIKVDPNSTGISVTGATTTAGNTIKVTNMGKNMVPNRSGGLQITR